MKNINDSKHWDERFIENGTWESHNGIQQTIYWGKLILTSLPNCIKKDIQENKMSISDIGCALGQTTKLFKNNYMDSEVVGYDFSNVAITRCKKQYDDIKFICGKINKNYDVVILSNIIEHMENSIQAIIDHLNYTNKYCVILCPYKEDMKKLAPEHVVSIDEKILIDKINNFDKIFQKIIDVRKSGFWSGKMVLCVYKKNTE
jgi:SAM-dependent methyltransferase